MRGLQGSLHKQYLVFCLRNCKPLREEVIKQATWQREVSSKCKSLCRTTEDQAKVSPIWDFQFLEHCLESSWEQQKHSEKQEQSLQNGDDSSDRRQKPEEEEDRAQCPVWPHRASATLSPNAFKQTRKQRKKELWSFVKQLKVMSQVTQIE